MATLPAQIQRQVDHAEALLTQVNGPAEPAQTTVEAVAAPVAPPPEVEAPAAAPTPPTNTPARKDTEETWEHRYKTLQGMHNRNMADMRTRLDQLAAQNEALNQQVKESSAPPAKPETMVDPKDSEVFGQDLVDMVTRVAERMFGSAVQAFDKRIGAIESRLTGTTQAVAQTAESVFLANLKERVPDYEAINTDQDFLLWLGEEDPVYGVPRQRALTSAAEALDANRVAKIFLAYKALTAQAAPKTAPTSQLERQTSPSPSGTAPPQLRTQLNYITTADVNAFYEDVRKGKYRGRESERQQLEQTINNALAQNRIVDRVPRNTAF